MTRRNITQVMAITAIAALGLVGCGSNGQEASSEDVDRQAFASRGVEVCISREANAGPMTATFLNSSLSQGNGPFNLDYVQCGRTEGTSLDFDIADASNKKVLNILAENPSVGSPDMTVTALVERLYDSHSFSSGESYTYNVGPYSVRVQRQSDTETSKFFRVWVSRA
jgi:hypothetical protein